MTESTDPRPDDAPLPAGWALLVRVGLDLTDVVTLAMLVLIAVTLVVAAVIR